MNNLEESKRAAKVYWKSRMDGKKSQEFMALSLGVSKNTVSNWERGTSSPSMKQTAQWFRTLGLNPFKYYLEYYYPDTYQNIDVNSYDKNLEQAIHHYIDNMDEKSKQDLAYLLLGDHGSSVFSVLQMLVAHLHTDMRSRVGVAELISRNFEICKATDSLVCTDQVMPDMELLNKSIELGHEAVIKKQSGYTIAED